MFVGDIDDICSAPAAHTESYEIQTLQNYYLLKNADHGLAMNNKADFFDLLRKEITTETSSTPVRQVLDLESFVSPREARLARIWEFMAQMTFLSIASSLATYSAA